LHSMRVRAFSKSHVGVRRSNNEDSCLVDEDLHMYVVADGMGGHESGEVASALAVQTVQSELSKHRKDLEARAADGTLEGRRLVLERLNQSVHTAHRTIFETSKREQQKRGMGTTLDMLYLCGGNAYLAHVGDSRVYLARGGTIYQLTEDHTLAAQQLRNGQITEADFAKSPVRNIIYQALGVVPNLEVDTLHLDVYPGDLFLLCSDGLYESLGPSDMAQILQDAKGEAAVDLLIDLGCVKGGHDNLTVVLVYVEDGPNTVRETVETNVKIRMLQNMPVFADLSYQELLKILKIAFEQEVKAGQMLFRDGDPADALYILLSGTVNVEKDNTILTTLSRGSHFGEMALISNQERSASVRVTAPGRVLVIRRDDFYDLTQAEPEMAIKLLWRFVHHLGERVRALSGDLARLNTGRRS
jgi:serine/threonine protein phosphatase PrpC